MTVANVSAEDMARLRHAALTQWSERDGKTALWSRVGADPHAGHVGRCEGCGLRRPLDPSHRVARSQLGTWSPVNLIGLCRPCHDLVHSRQYMAHGLGWEVESGTDPWTVAAWIITAGLTRPAWHLLDVELDAVGVRRHVVRFVTASWVQ